MRAYFDHNATSPLKPRSRQAMLAALAHGNPSSIHQEGRAARAIVDNAREVLARCLGVLPTTIVFTSGGTEANNLAIRGFQGRASDCFLDRAPERYWDGPGARTGPSDRSR